MRCLVWSPLLTLLILCAAPWIGCGKKDATPAPSASATPSPPPPPPPRYKAFLYVAAQTIGSISVYEIDPGTGGLTERSSSVRHGSLTSIGADPFNKYFYALAGDSGSALETFWINPVTGELATGANSPSGSGPVEDGELAIHPNGKFVYATQRSGNIVNVRTVEHALGVSTVVSSKAAGTSPRRLAMHPSGTFLYVIDAGGIGVFGVDADTGALSAKSSSVAAGTDPSSITIAPSGKFAYVTDSVGGNVLIYALDPTTGAPTALGTPGTACGGAGRLAIHPAERFAYVSCRLADKMISFAVDPTTGRLTSIGASGLALEASGQPASVALAPDGKTAYVANFAKNTVSVIGLDPDTGLPLGETRVMTGAGPVSLQVLKVRQP